MAYAETVKHQFLLVPPGPVVSKVAALSMARGVAQLLGAEVAVAVTGVGGPGTQKGQPPGTVWVATFPDDLGPAVLLDREGDPQDVCRQVCDEAIQLLADRLGA